MTSILANGQAAGTIVFSYDPSTEEGAEEKGAYA